MLFGFRRSPAGRGFWCQRARENPPERPLLSGRAATSTLVTIKVNAVHCIDTRAGELGQQANLARILSAQKLQKNVGRPEAPYQRSYVVVMQVDILPLPNERKVRPTSPEFCHGRWCGHQTHDPCSCRVRLCEFAFLALALFLASWWPTAHPAAAPSFTVTRHMPGHPTNDCAFDAALRIRSSGERKT